MFNPILKIYQGFKISMKKAVLAMYTRFWKDKKKPELFGLNI